MLAKRLEPVLPAIINNDQTGFIKNRLLFHNIRRALNIKFILQTHKAFDRVEWDYLFFVLRKVGFGNVQHIG